MQLQKVYILSLLLCVVVSTMSCRDTNAPSAGGVELLWKRDLNLIQIANASAGITVDGNALYFADTYSKFFKIGTDGKGLREYDVRTGSTFGVPVIDGGLVVVGVSAWGANTGAAHLYALNKETLETVWAKHNFVWHPVPAIDESYVYCTEYYKVYAFDKNSGAEIWNTDVFGKNVYNPVIDGDRLYFATGAIFQEDGYLYCLNKLSGEIVFQDTLPYMESRSQFGGSPVGVEVWQDYVYVPAHNRYLYCFDKDDGALRWKFLADAPLFTPARVFDGIVYTGSLNRTCYAINAKSGDLIWSYQTVGSIDRNPPQFYQDYVLFESGDILIFEKNSGKLVAELTPRNGLYSYFTAAWHSDGKIFTTGFDKNTRKKYVFAYQF